MLSYCSKNLYFFLWNTKDIWRIFQWVLSIATATYAHTHLHNSYSWTQSIISIIKRQYSASFVHFLCFLRIKPSSHCGPFRNRNMLELGKKWIINLENSNPSMQWLSWAYVHLVDNPLFLFIIAGLFLWVFLVHGSPGCSRDQIWVIFKNSSPSLSRTIIYIHMQVLDGQKMIIEKLQEQIDHVSIMTLVENYTLAYLRVHILRK